MLDRDELLKKFMEAGARADLYRYQRDEALTMVQALYDKLPKERHDYSGVGWCAGCGAVLYCGDGKGRDECKPDCVLALTRALLEKTR